MLSILRHTFSLKKEIPHGQRDPFSRHTFISRWCHAAVISELHSYIPLDSRRQKTAAERNENVLFRSGFLLAVLVYVTEFKK